MARDQRLPLYWNRDLERMEFEVGSGNFRTLPEDTDVSTQLVDEDGNEVEVVQEDGEYKLAVADRRVLDALDEIKLLLVRLIELQEERRGD